MMHLTVLYLTTPHENQFQLKSLIAKNRAILYPIIDLVVTMGQQNISFRGYRDDSQYHPPVGEYSRSGNVGNFVELLNYKIRNCWADDCQLKNHLTTCHKNATHISKRTQNEFIQICGTQNTKNNPERNKGINVFLLSSLRSER